MNTQLLNVSHQEQLVNLLAGQKTYFGLPISQFPFTLTDWRSMALFSASYLLEDNPYNRCYGAFDGDKLVGTICSDFLLDQPMWMLRRICVSEDLKGPESEEIRQALMKAVIEFAESKGFTQHLYLIPAKYARAHAKIWRNNEARADRYVACELEFVPAGMPSRFRLFWEHLYGRVRFPIDTVVRMSTLLDSARKEG